MLHNLVKSLTPNEKRHFSMFSSAPGEPQNFRKLFAAYEGLNSVDAGAIRKKMGNRRINLSYEKAYLQRMLLKSLRNYHEESTEQITLLNNLINIEILFNKQQYDLCLGIIERSRQIARESQLYQTQLLLINWEKRCMVRLGNYSFMENYIHKGLKEERRLLELQENISEFRALQMHLIAIINHKGNIRRQVDSQKLAAIIKHPLMKSEKMAKSFQARLIYYEILMLWHSHNDSFAKAYTYNALALKLLETTPGAIERNRHPYFSFLANMVNRALSVDRTHEVAALVLKLENFLKTCEGVVPLSQYREMRAYCIERKLLMHAYSFNYKEAIEFAEAVLPEIETPDAALRKANRIVFYYFLSMSYFFTGQYTNALIYLRKILDGYDDSVRLDFIFMSHLLHFLTHYKLKNGELLPYLLKSIQRFSASRGLKNEVNDLVLKFLSALTKTFGDRKLSKEVMKKYHYLLLPYKDDFERNAIIGNLDILKWIEDELRVG